MRIMTAGQQTRAFTQWLGNTYIDNRTKNKLVDQHVKLKSQLQELGEKMDEIIEK